MHPQLQQDSFSVGHFDLCELRLINDSQYPWCILVPKRLDIREVYQLNSADQQQLQIESCYLAEQLAVLYNADKMNIAAIGNVVPQLHIHHIVRFRQDKAWPAPVWGKYPAIPYSDSHRTETLKRLQQQLKVCTEIT
ncbi:MAG: HIT domain-containing protein [Methylococcaceae bacterium]|nr:HIT domain-containing protein [Methylococcaceae bacterium]